MTKKFYECKLLVGMKMSPEDKAYYDEHKAHPFLDLLEDSLKGVGLIAGGAVLTGFILYSEMHAGAPLQFPANTGEATLGLGGIGMVAAGIVTEIMAIPDFIGKLNDNRYLRRSLKRG